MTDVSQSKKLSSLPPLASVASLVAEAKKKGKTVVLCHGVFDLIHPGHIRHLESAKKEGDILVVSVTPDRYVNRGPGRPVFPQELRAEVLASLSCVDYAVINEWPTAVEMIQKLQPHLYVKGSDYKEISNDITGRIMEEEKAIRAVGGKMVFTNEITFSSSSLANNFLNLFSEEVTAFLKDFRTRVNEASITAHLDKAANCKVLVIGDTIIDEYYYCTPMGKSPKENVIATRYVSEETFAGGVLAAANHVASLCNQVDLITYLGKEPAMEDFIRSRLKRNVSAHFFKNDHSPTTLKRRFVEPNYMRKLFEIVFINGNSLPEEEEQAVYDHLDKIISNYDLVLVTDFGHGLMGPKLVDLVCKKAKFLAVNAQTNSANIGFNLITKYPRADYVCIDEPEARLALHDNRSDLDTIIKRLSAKLDAAFVTITHGNRGCIVYSKKEGTFRIPVLTKTVVDTVGAGDAFLSLSSPCVAAGVPMEQVGFIGNAAGALKVGIVGNRTSVEKLPLIKFITTLIK